MGEQLGYVYKITNDINDKVYIGETTRSLEVRFQEHAFEKRSTSRIHKAIQELGWQHFKIQEIERVPISQLYERETYWISEYNSYHNGYNGNPSGQWEGGNQRYWDSVHVIEPNIYFDSAEDMGRKVHSLTSWSFRFCNDKVKECLSKNIPFLDYHLEYKRVPIEEISSIEDQENWIKTLNIQFAGKHLYCPQLNQEFETTGQAAKYILDNNYYTGQSKIPNQAVIGIIGNMLKNPEYECAVLSGLTFEQLPGATKNAGSQEPFKDMCVHCNELDMDFNSQKEAAQYMIDNGYWSGIKLKTARLRLSDIINGLFDNYKGYSFSKL